MAPMAYLVDPSGTVLYQDAATFQEVFLMNQ